MRKMSDAEEEKKTTQVVRIPCSRDNHWKCISVFLLHQILTYSAL